jgi:hypothetical protein
MKLNAETKNCKDCDEQVRLNSDGLWVTADATDFDICSITDSNHTPAPEFTKCENGCGNEVAWNYDETERYCERCVAEYEQQLRDQEWDYRQ